MTRIFVENQELELSADISHQLTFSIDDIRNLDSKTTSFSKTIVIPGTEKNNKLFGNLFELSNANFPEEGGNLFYNFDVSKSVNARIEINGLQAMKGVLRLMSITVDKGAIDYEIAVFGELGGFISTLSSKKLEDLNFSDYDHEWNYNNIVNTWPELKTYTIAGSYVFELSPDPYDPDYSLYRLRISGNYSVLKAQDKITISGSSCNNGTFTIRYVIRNILTNRTYIYFNVTLSTCSGTGISLTTVNPYGYGYVYPLIDYGQSAPVSGFTINHDFEYTTFRPALFVREYMDRIITNAGYTWESEFFDTNFFRSLIIPNNDARLEKRGENYYVDASDDYTYSFTSASTRVQKYTFGTSTLDPSWSAQDSNTTFRYDNANILSVKASVNLIGSIIKPELSKVTFKIIRKTAAGHYDDIAVYNFDNPTSYINKQLNISFNGTFTINETDKVYVDIIYDHGQRCGYNFDLDRIECNPIAEGTTLNITSLSLTIQPEPEGFAQYQLDDTIKMNDAVPKNILQKDFFASIMKMFNLMVVESQEKTRHLIIEPYVNYYQTTIDTYEDWTYKVNRDKPMVIKPMSEINARTYEFKYKEDSDYYNEIYKKHFNQTYGNRDFDNSLEFAKDKQSVEIIFSPSVLVGFQGEEKVWPAIYDYDENTGVKTPKAHNVRIMQIKHVEGVAEWNILQNNDTSIGSQTDYLYAGHLNDPDYPTNDINWGAPKQLFFELVSGSLQYNLFNNFYSPYMAEIIDKDSRLLTCEMKLTETDIFNLDFSRFKMIDGVLFRLMKITDWSEGNLCKVDLLRVINTTYIPDTLLTSKTFRMTYNDLGIVDTMLSGNHANVSDWNTFFGLAPGNQFTSCFVEGSDIILIGNVHFNIADGLFNFNNNILAIIDNLGCVDNVGIGSFDSSTIENFRSVSVKRIYDSCFNASQLRTFDAPECLRIDDLSFNQCNNLTTLYLNKVNQLGATINNDQVFEGINGNYINITINKPVLRESGGDYTEGDFVYLLSNNTVNLTIV